MEIGKLLEEQIIEFNKYYVATLDTMVKSAPAGSEVVAAAVKSAIAGVDSAYDNLPKSAQQFAEMTQANAEAATVPTAIPGKKKAA